MKKLLISICLFSVLSYCYESFGQTKIDQAEISSTIQELTDFHDVIYPMWHDAYPAKDYNTLKGFVPKIKSYMESINKVKLPGILREKETAWESQLNELNNSAQNYYAAASSNNNNDLLTAVEKLHTSYEKMVRALRPALKEIDDFHQTLYIIYHKLLPDSKYDEIAGLTGTLITKAEAIVNYPQDKLKTRLGDKLGAYNVSAEKLIASVTSLKEVLKSNDPAKKKEAIESMHKAYEGLDSLFK
jgi:hypothetical protein